MSSDIAAASAVDVSVSRGTRADVPTLVAREAPALLAYFARRVDPVDDAADLLGDTLVIVWRRQSVIPADETRARMWLYGVARKVLSTYRRSSVRRNALAERLRDQLGSVPSEGAHGSNSLEDHVRALIADLNDRDREIMEMVYWDGFSLVEVATILSMRPATVRSRHARARAQLRDALAETRDVEPGNERQEH